MSNSNRSDKQQYFQGFYKFYKNDSQDNVKTCILIFELENYYALGSAISTRWASSTEITKYIKYRCIYITPC